MERIGDRGRVATCILVITIILGACGLSSGPESTPAQISNPTPTPTPTVVIPPAISPSPEAVSKCKDLSGMLEVQVLVGPAEAVGLEPVAVGEIPFSVMSEGESHLVQGGGPISYQAVLEKAWGTYSVNLDLDTSIQGECRGETGSEALDLTIEASGDQMVEVRAEGFSGDYPWSGTNTFNLTFPLVDGSIQQGEGWVFVLHLNQ